MRTVLPRGRSHSISLGTRAPAAGAFGLEMMPTVLMTGIEEKLLVPFGAGDGALDEGGLEPDLDRHQGAGGGCVRLGNDADGFNDGHRGETPCSLRRRRWGSRRGRSGTRFRARPVRLFGKPPGAMPARGRCRPCPPGPCPLQTAV